MGLVQETLEGLGRHEEKRRPAAWVSTLYGAGARRTGRLMESIRARYAVSGGSRLEVEYRFASYGRFVDWGVGRGRPLRAGGGYTDRPGRARFYSRDKSLQRYIMANILRHKLRRGAEEALSGAFGGKGLELTF